VMQDCANPPSKNNVEFANAKLWAHGPDIFIYVYMPAQHHQWKGFLVGARKVQTCLHRPAPSVRMYIWYPTSIGGNSQLLFNSHALATKRGHPPIMNDCVRPEQSLQAQALATR